MGKYIGIKMIEATPMKASIALEHGYNIEDFIAAKESVKVGTKTTNTTLTTITGFEVHGQSACVNPDNFNMQIGEQYASEKAKDQLWFALGFVLQWAKNGIKRNK